MTDLMKHLLALTFAVLLLVAAARAQDWPTYGGDLGATRYSSARQIDRANVAALGVAWTYHTANVGGAAKISGKAPPRRRRFLPTANCSSAPRSIG